MIRYTTIVIGTIQIAEKIKTHAGVNNGINPNRCMKKESNQELKIGVISIIALSIVAPKIKIPRTLRSALSTDHHQYERTRITIMEIISMVPPN